MKTVRVSKSIMDALNVKGYAEGKKFVYVVHDKLSQNCIEVRADTSTPIFTEVEVMCE